MSEIRKGRRRPLRAEAAAPSPPRLEVAPAPHLVEQRADHAPDDDRRAHRPRAGGDHGARACSAGTPSSRSGSASLSCLAAEAVFMSWRGRRPTLGDGSAAVTGVILGLSLPASAPWYVGVVGVGRGHRPRQGRLRRAGPQHLQPRHGRPGLRDDLRSPAALGAGAYVIADVHMEVVTQATPLTAAKQARRRVTGAVAAVPRQTSTARSARPAPWPA